MLSHLVAGRVHIEFGFNFKCNLSVLSKTDYVFRIVEEREVT